MPDWLDRPASPNAGEIEQGFDLHEMLSFGWRQWKFITTVVVAVFLIGMIFLLHETPLYTATTQVLLSLPREKAPGSETNLDDVRWDAATLYGQMSIIRSTVFLRRVVARENLLAAGSEPPARPSLLSSVRSFVLSLVELPRSEEQPHAKEEPDPVAAGPNGIPPAELRAIEALQGALRVGLVEQEGFTIAISVTSVDPNRAARLANAIAEAYLVDKLDTRFEATKRASAWLSDRLVGLREQLRASEETVTKFRAEHGLVGSDGVTLSQQQLSELSAKLINAKAELAQKRAQVELLDAIAAKGRGLENMPAVAQAGQLPKLRAEANSLSTQEANLLARYGAAHPLVVNIQAQLRDVDRSMTSETQRLAAGIRNDYQLAEAQVASLERSFQQATGKSNLDDATAIRLRELERMAAVNKVLFEDFLKQAKFTEARSTFEPQDVRIITPAVPPGSPSFPNKVRFITINLLIGLLLGIGGALAKEKLNAGFTTPKQIEDLVGVPLLASVSHMSNRSLTVDRTVIPLHDQPLAVPLSRFGETIRMLRIGVQMTDVDHPPKVIQVTSALPREGKTTISLSLAASAAAAKLKVLFIDADLRHSKATRIFGREKEPGLVDILLGDAAIEDAMSFYAKGGFWGLGAGSKTNAPTDILSSERMKTLVAKFKQDYDLVIIDTPPARLVMDPLVISHISDKIVVVVKWSATARDLVKGSVIQLSGGHKIAGVAYNQVNERRAQKYGRQAYAYYYGNRQYDNYHS
jgi:capsular exopolysaccharide synthesis family protein